MKFRDALPDMSRCFSAGLALKYFKQSVLKPGEGDIEYMSNEVWKLSTTYSDAYNNWRSPHLLASFEEQRRQREAEDD